MINDYEILINLTNSLNKSKPLIDQILLEGKEKFANNENHISIAISILDEFHEIVSNLEEIIIFSKKLYELIFPLYNYYEKMFNNYKFVNAYKLYDSLYIDLNNIRTFLNELNK